MEAQRTTSGVWTDALDAIDLRTARALLMPSLSGFAGGETVGGSLALGVSQNRLWELYVQGLRTQVEAVISESLLKDMHAMSGYAHTVGPPRLVLRPLTADDKASTLATWNALVQSGAVNGGDERDESHIRRLLSFPSSEEGENVALSEASHRRGGRHTSSGGVPPQTFSARLLPHKKHDPPAEPWRELSRHEKRIGGLDRIKKVFAETEPALAEVIATGVEELVADVRGKVAARDRFTPEQVVALKPSDKVMATLRKKIERELYGAYLKGSQTALDEIEAARTGE